MKLLEIVSPEKVDIGGVTFTNDELIEIALLIHDKRHTRVDYETRVGGVEKAVKNFSVKSPDLWRGLYEPELEKFQVGARIKPNGYMSMSEKRELAERFGTRTKTIVHAKGITAFPYWSWNIKHMQEPLKKRDPESWVRNDGDYMVDSLKEESEWLVSHDTEFEVISKNEDGKYTVIEIKEV